MHLRRHESGQDIGVRSMAYHRKDRPNQAVVDKGIDAAVFHHGPSVLSSRNVSFAIQSNMRERIAIDESAIRR